MSTALIPYTPPKTPMEFIKYEVERSLSNGSISILDSINLNLSSIAIIFGKMSDMRDLSLSSRRIERQSFGHIEISQSLSISGGSMRGTGRFSLDHSPNISEDLQRLMNSLVFDNLQAPSRMSHISASQKHNGDEIAETMQSEASFTISTDIKPIVATYGCGPCVALGGYDATNKIAFIVHFSNAGEVRSSGGLILDNIFKLAKIKIESPIQLHLRGGIEGVSEATIEAIRMWMKQTEDLPVEIASEDVLDSETCFSGKSLSIDSRNGEVAEYDPLANPRRRGMGELDVISAMKSAFHPNIKLAYSPK